MNNTNHNQKGFVLAVIPVALAIIGFVGTGAFANHDYQKGMNHSRDIQRVADVKTIEKSLITYYTQNNKYPLQKNQSNNGLDALQHALGKVPSDPLAGKGWSYRYWSDEQTYTLRYLLESTGEEKVVFGE